jgi:glutamate carboxypeptidase
MSLARDTDTVGHRAPRLLEELCEISSPSGDVQGLRRMASRVGEELGGFGFECVIHDERGRDGTSQPVLVARRPGAETDYVLMVGHLDTVLPAIAPRRLGDRLDATGALDMKGGFAALVGALELLCERGSEPGQDLLLVAVPDEEVGGPISERAVREWGRGARAVLVLEPGEGRGDAESIVTGRRGLIGWRLRATGRASHSGLGYWEGRSAIGAAAMWCGRAQVLSEPGEGPIVNVGRILGGDAEFVDDLAEHHALVGTNYRLNIVSDRCVAEGEVRFLSVVDGERMLDLLRGMATEIATSTGVEMTFEVFERIAPVDPSGPGSELAEFLVGAADRAGWRLELEHDRGGVSFPNFLEDPTAVPVLDGLGPVGGGMHTRGEWVDLRSLGRRIDLLAALLEHLRES